MTDEQINIEIAQHLGWRAIAFSYGIGVIGIPPARNECDPVHLKSVMWTADLNAMHEAEKVLTKAQWGDFVEHLTTDFYSVSDAWKDACHATARQRAEAFLRTLGKWDDQSGEATEMVKEVQK